MERKLVIIGIDSLIPTIIEKLVEMNRLPTFKKLMEEGSYSRALPYWPTETGCNWATIATGTPPSKHGCKYVIHIPGTSLDKTVFGFSSEYCRAEQIWQVVDKLGKLSIIIDYPQSYPINIKNVIHIGEDGYPGPNSRFCIANAHAYTNVKKVEELPEYLKKYLTIIEIRNAINWRNLPERRDLLEIEIPLKTREETIIFYGLIEKEDGKYSKVLLFSEKNYMKKLGEAKRGEWSNWIKYCFKLHGKKTYAYFRYKVIELSPDGRKIHIYFSEIYPEEGWAYPSELARELIDIFGPYLHRPTEQAIVVSGASDTETFIEEQEYQANWYTRVAKYLLKKYDWRLFIMKWHGPDFFEHFTLHLIDPTHPLFDSNRKDEGWRLYARFYGICDRMIAEILETVDDGNTIISVVGDHGHVANIVYHVGNEILEKEGYLYRNPDGSINWSKTKAIFVAEGVWINLRGRDPNGIVKLGEEYEKMRDEIINILLNLKNPITGEPVFSLVCRKEDAKILGMGGDRDPDIIFCYNVPMYSKINKATISRHPIWGLVTGTHGAFLPSVRTRIGTIETVFIVKGPKVKKGYKRPISISLSSVAPTLCYLSNIPIPKDAEGPILYDIIEK
ncbi:MAG: hypothetical protein DRJ45_02455 [Thermoprotei archaeon]|nr:MAG: hypothetical protein DRJ45_02455 [Thermoprotei archaeon]